MMSSAIDGQLPADLEKVLSKERRVSSLYREAASTYRGHPTLMILFGDVELTLRICKQSEKYT